MTWQATDQDLLNIVAMTTDVPLTTLGPDGMDFVPGGYVMSHAVNSPKPWGRSYLKVALTGATARPSRQNVLGEHRTPHPPVSLLARSVSQNGDDGGHRARQDLSSP
jgi:hypothetical protein